MQAMSVSMASSGGWHASELEPPDITDIIIIIITTIIMIIIIIIIMITIIMIMIMIIMIIIITPPPHRAFRRAPAAKQDYAAAPHRAWPSWAWP
jgi:hypothetical protein